MPLWSPELIGKKRLWSKVAGCHAFVEWQAGQPVGNPDARWFGFDVRL